MKIIILSRSFFLGFIIMVYTDCNKPAIETATQNGFTRVNMAYANADIIIETPANSIMLNGRVKNNGWNHNIILSVWKKIKGHANGIIENPNSIQSKVSALEKGVYEFELTVWDNQSHYDTDTMTLIVEEPAATPKKQVTFLNMKMIVDSGPLFGYNFFAIEHFYEFVPPNTPFEVFIKMQPSINWQPLILFPQNDPQFTGYAYSISNNGAGSLQIDNFPDGFNFICTADIKIVF
jgi:hypothetical protein